MKINIGSILLAWGLMFVAPAFSGNADDEAELKAHVRPADLKQFHFPIDGKNNQVWVQFYVCSYEVDSIKTLVNAGGEIVPSIIKAIEDQRLFKRRYAIGALGYLKDRSAVPILTNIARDNAEVDYFRGDALESLFLTDPALGSKEATKILQSETSPELNPYLRSIAGKIVSDPDSIRRELKELREK